MWLGSFLCPKPFLSGRIWWLFVSAILNIPPEALQVVAEGDGLRVKKYFFDFFSRLTFILCKDQSGSFLELYLTII